MDTRKAGWFFLIAVVLAAIAMTASVTGVPSGPTITYTGESTAPSSAIAPTLESNASIGGGDIATVVLTAKEINDHWKAYVGNVTGTMALEDSSNYSIYEWTMSAPTGEVYATRTSTTVTWTNILCANVTNVASEQTKMGHNATYTPTDSIGQTFDDDANNHWGFVAGDSVISANSCAYSINPWVNGTANTANIFEEVLLFDGSNILYTSRIQDNLFGYHTGNQYDFQMLVAENATPGASRTNYYFYVELV